MKTTKTHNRRNFLLAASLGTAGVAAAVVAKSPALPLKDGAAPAASQPNGYHTSEHIQKYYKTTKV